MNAAFAASNMVNQPQRPEGLLILRLRGLFLCGVLPCSRGCAGAEEASTASAAPIMECCKRTALSRPGRTRRLMAFSNWLAPRNTTLRKNHAGLKKNGVKAQLAQADGDARKRRAAGFARCWPCPPRPCHAHRRRHKSGALPLAVHGGPLWQPLCYPRRGGPGLASFITLLLVRVLYAIFVPDLNSSDGAVPL